jgi:hypothetical protein
MDHGAVECERKKDVSSFVLGAEKGCGRVWGAAAPTQEGADAVWLSRAVQMGGRSVFSCLARLDRRTACGTGCSVRSGGAWGRAVARGGEEIRGAFGSLLCFPG